MPLVQANAGPTQAEPRLEQPAVEPQGTHDDVAAADQASEDGVLGDSMLSVDALRISEDEALLAAPGAHTGWPIDGHAAVP